MAPRRYRHVAQIPEPTLHTRRHHRRCGPLRGPKYWYNSYGTDTGVQTEGTCVDSQGTPLYAIV